MTEKRSKSISSDKRYKKLYYSKLYLAGLWSFIATFTLSVLFLILSVNCANSQSSDTLSTQYSCADKATLVAGLPDYTDILITVIIAVGIALITIDATVFIFSKSALDRIIDENRYIERIARIHKEKTISLLFVNCIVSTFALLLPLGWHFSLSFWQYFHRPLFYIGLSFLVANTVVYLGLSYDFLKKCVKIEKYLRKIIKTNFDEYAQKIEDYFSPDDKRDRLKIIGDWSLWEDRDFAEEAKIICEQMSRDEFINSFKKAEKLLIPDESGSEASIRKVKIVTTFQERKSIFESLPKVEASDIKERYYFHKAGESENIFECIKGFESKVKFPQDDDGQKDFFTETEEIYSLLKEYCNLLISERFTVPISDNHKDGQPLTREEMYLSKFAEAFYSFYIRILAIFVSSVYISDYSFNDTSLNYANFYNSTLENITLFCATFYRTILIRTTFKKVIMDMSKYEDIDFYSSTLLDSSMNNSELVQVRFERANVQNGGFDACSFKICKFYDSDFTDCNFNNTEYTDTKFRGSNFINSKFREIDVKNGLFDSCSFESSELSKWTVEGKLSIITCDFSKSTWSEMEITDWDLTGSVFNKASLAGTKFHHITMNSADFTDCSLAETEITDCKMISSTLKNASLFDAKLKNVDLTMADLSSAIAVQATFEYNCSLKNTNCDNADFSEAEFTNADLEAARLYNCSLTKSKIKNTNCKYLLADKMQFTFAECNDCDFSYGSLSSSNLTRTTFTACAFIGTDLSDTNATETVFKNCKLKNVDFSDTRFMKAKFLGESKDDPMILVNCDFSDCKFEEVTFKNVKFINCVFKDSVMLKCKNTNGQLITEQNAKKLFGSDSISITFQNAFLLVKEKIRKYKSS